MKPGMRTRTPQSSHHSTLDTTFRVVGLGETSWINQLHSKCSKCSQSVHRSPNNEVRQRSTPYRCDGTCCCPQQHTTVRGSLLSNSFIGSSGSRLDKRGTRTRSIHCQRSIAAIHSICNCSGCRTRQDHHASSVFYNEGGSYR